MAYALQPEWLAMAYTADIAETGCRIRRDSKYCYDQPISAETAVIL